VISSDGGRCTGARIYVGATPRIAVPASGAAAALEGTDLSDDAITVAAGIAAEEIRTGDDLRGDASYRTRLIRVGVSRCLTEARQRIGEGGA